MSLGYSYPHGKQEIKEILEKYINFDDKILDVGAGGATYYKLLGPRYSWSAIDIWPESIEECKKYYKNVYEIDIRDFTYSEDYDLIIFGDILEHLSVEDAQRVLHEAEQHAKHIMVAVPYQLTQHALDGNEAEIHIQNDLTPWLMEKRYPELRLVIKIMNLYGYYLWHQT